MIIKKYTVKSMNEALTRIRYELGKDAIIISQRKIKSPGFKGYFSPKLIEVTAALENNKKAVKAEKEEEEDESFKESLEGLKKLMDIEELNNKDTLSVKSKELEKSSEEDSKLTEEVREMKELLNKVIKNTSKEEEKDLSVEFMKEIDINEKYFKEIKQNCSEDFDIFKEDFKKILNSKIQINSEDLLGRVVLVGPTGVGKTTTIAKLAGRLALIEKKKVGLITIDTYRIGAVDQLKTYAEIMNLPFKVVNTIKEMESSVEALSYCDVILIDTTGRSSKNTMQISELRAYVQNAKPDHTALVLSGTTKNRDIDTILSGYEELKYDKIIITKLDETTVYGGIFNIINKANKPVSFITTGQNVPDDIKVPTKDRLIKLIIGEETIC
ncbi:flagellar biosynthesis protein FlhF [Clostridium gasigenes]|uniref:Flagellar biosynthesis protein FlhF n=1 Tax=Clostridium gasigenes TaxID=94869 RepID=A0A1H0TTI1_9CLOT|nr:flagellar biosynthesis protein FlhF [Clostridium gasigenes]MBB6624245.1 flagellar biosynthesis protein FlhF [Clostridium gasigenes]SDP57269.1 flagellar biosynthesis protein FlhF [Clostridium gasigenes]